MADPIEFSLALIYKGRVIQTSLGTHTREGAPQVMSNHLGASSKSNKRESPDGDASSALRRMWLLILGQGLKLNHKSSSHPSPCLDPLKDLSLGRVGEVFWKLERECSSCEVSMLQEIC